jgi:peroxiredoxin
MTLADLERLHKLKETGILKGGYDLFKWISLSLLVPLFIWTLYNGLHGDREKAQEGQKAPQIHLNSAQGDPVKLSDYKGEFIALNFWATWCEPCKTEMPILEEFSQQAEGAAVIGINMTNNEASQDQVLHFMKENKIHFPILLDSSGKVFEKYNIMSLPSTFFINKEGVIVKYHAGPLTVKDLHEITEEFD